MLPLPTGHPCSRSASQALRAGQRPREQRLPVWLIERRGFVDGATAAQGGMDGPRDPLTVAQPIDHIFQFHRALRRELDKLEKQAQQLLDLHTGAPPPLAPMQRERCV